MKANISIVAALAIMTAPAFAQEPSPSPAPVEKAPSTQTEPMTPAAPPAAEAPAPMAPSATEPAPSMAPAAPDKEAAAPAPSAPTTAVGALKKSDDDAKMVPALNASVDKVEEMDVFDANGKKIAEVDSVLEDSNGEVKGVAIEYGGFLGFGSKDAILTFDQVKAQDGKLITTITEDQLGTLPAWDD